MHDKQLLFFITAFQVFSHTKLGLTSIDIPFHNQVPTSHMEELQKELEVLIEILHYVRECEKLSNQKHHLEKEMKWKEAKKNI